MRISPSRLGALALALAVAACSDGPTTPPTADAPLDYGYGAVDAVYFDVGLTLPTSFSVIDNTTVANGGFENNGGANTPAFADWATSNAGNGAWLVQTGTNAPNGFPVDAPPEGDFAAMSVQGGPGQHILYQDVTLPSSNAVLHFSLQLENRAGNYFSPASLSHNAAGANQQFRADLMDPGAPLDDVGAGVLLNLYQTQPGDATSTAYFTVSTDVSAFKGQTVRIRFAEVDNQFFFQAGVDNVYLEILDPETKDECKNGGWEGFGFKNQGQCVRFVETGKDSRP